MSKRKLREGWRQAGGDDGDANVWWDRKVDEMWLCVGGWWDLRREEGPCGGDVRSVPPNYEGPWAASVQYGDSGARILQASPFESVRFSTKEEAMAAAEKEARMIGEGIMKALAPKKRKAA